jgi:hypothetical protein
MLFIKVQVTAVFVLSVVILEVSYQFIETGKPECMHEDFSMLPCCNST